MLQRLEPKYKQVSHSLVAGEGKKKKKKEVFWISTDQGMLSMCLKSMCLKVSTCTSDFQ